MRYANQGESRCAWEMGPQHGSELALEVGTCGVAVLLAVGSFVSNFAVAAISLEKVASLHVQKST